MHVYKYWQAFVGIVSSFEKPHVGHVTVASVVTAVMQPSYRRVSPI